MSQPQPLEFMRVHVPAGRLTDVPLGDGRYVPMSAREFEEGIARLSAGRPATVDTALEPPFGPLATAARYVLSLADDGSLAGNVSFDVGPAGGGNGQIVVPREMPLGTLDVRSGSMKTAAGLGAAVLYGRRDGSMAVATPEAGTYTCEFRRAAEPGTDDVPRFSLPLVPSLSSSITLRLPRGIRPVFVGAAAARELPPAADVQAASGQAANGGPTASAITWRIDTGPRGTIEVVLVADERPAPAVAVWTDMGVHGSQSSLDVRVQPRTPWLAGQLRLEKDPETRVTRVAVAADGMHDVAAAWTVADEGRTLVIELPPQCVGTRLPLVVTAVAPVAGQATPLPMIHAMAASWAGGGIVIRVAPSLAVAALEPTRCMVVPPEAAARWPLSAAHEAVGHEPAPRTAGEAEAAATKEGQWRQRGQCRS